MCLFIVLGNSNLAQPLEGMDHKKKNLRKEIENMERKEKFADKNKQNRYRQTERQGEREREPGPNQLSAELMKFSSCLLLLLGSFSLKKIIPLIIPPINFFITQSLF